MNITKKEKDSLHQLINITISENDYEKEVDNTLKEYRKKMDLKGFRKGNVPMGVVKKRYYQGVKIEEINKLLQKSLTNYIEEQKLDIIGNPLPIETKDFNIESKEITFEFEIGIKPKFEVELKSLKVPFYDIEINDALIDKDVKMLQERYGDSVDTDSITAQSYVYAHFKNKDLHLDKENVFFSVEEINYADKIKKLKKGESILLPLHDFFKNEQRTTHLFEKPNPDLLKDKKAKVTITIEKINKRIPAELNQEFFDKLFGKDKITSLDKMKELLNKEKKIQLEKETEMFFFNDVKKKLINKCKFNIPTEFLKNWIISNAKEKQTAKDDIANQWTSIEENIRYQLIEEKIVIKNDLKTTEDELITHTKELIKKQLQSMGRGDEPNDSELDNITRNILQNKEEVKRIEQELFMTKILSLFKEQISADKKKISYDNFIKKINQK